MRRVRLLAAAVLALMAAVPGTAGGQTTTSSTTSTSTTATTLAQTTTTTSTLPNPCVGQSCTERPPEALFVAASGQVKADEGGFCWRSPAVPGGVCAAVSRTEGYQPPTLVVRQGEMVPIRFVSTPLLTPTAVALVRQGQTITLPASNPTSFRAVFPPGTRVVFDLDAQWFQGKSGYSIAFDVRAAGRSLSLTG